MTNVILPVMQWLTLGGTLNILKYDDYKQQHSIYKDSDVVARNVDKLNFTYYVLEEDKMPYSDLRMPIDLVHRAKTQRIPMHINYDFPRVILDDPVYDRLVLLVIAEYTTAITGIRKNASPVPKWKEYVPATSTHYAAEQGFGGRCIATIEIRMGVPGDTQVVRRIFTDIMGSSGQVGEDTPDFLRLWKKAIHEARKSPDVRGRIRMDEFKVNCRNAELPDEDLYSFRHTFKHLANLGKFTNTFSPQQQPIWASFEPLHNLDKQYPDLKINRASVRSLISLDAKLHDLLKVVKYGYRIPRGFSDQQMAEKKNFVARVDDVRKVLYDIATSDPSIYKDLGEEFSKALDRYSQGLNVGEKSYFSKYLKMHERKEMTCGMKFQRPTTGLLMASHEEQAENDYLEHGGLKKCKQMCRKEERCRAIQYDESEPNKCQIYYVSTYTAPIKYDEDETAKIYDRKCKFLEIGTTFRS